MPGKVFKTRFYIPPQRRSEFALKTSVHGTQYYEKKPADSEVPSAVPEKRSTGMRGWRHLRDSRRNRVLKELDVSASTLYETIEANTQYLTPEFCEKMFLKYHSHPAWSDSSFCFKIYRSLCAFPDYQETAFFKALKGHMTTKFGFA